MTEINEQFLEAQVNDFILAGYFTKDISYTLMLEDHGHEPDKEEYNYHTALVINIEEGMSVCHAYDQVCLVIESYGVPADECNEVIRSFGFDELIDMQ